MEVCVMAHATIALGPQLTAEQARAIFAQGEEAVIFALLELAKLLGQSQPAATAISPSTPSGMVPVYHKPTTSTRKNRPGRKTGHVGARRPPPAKIDQHQEHRAECCPHCQGRLT